MKKDPSKVKVRRNLTSYGYLLPALISIAVLTLYPVVYTVIMSFTNLTLKNRKHIGFVGFANYGEALSGEFSKVFLPVFGWTLTYALFATLGGFLVGLILAMLLSNKNIKEAWIYKGILIIPWALPAAVAVMSWQGLLNSSYGAINTVLLNLHVISEPIQWLISPFWARTAIIICTIWLGAPYMMNVSMGALAAIPEAYYEAAEVDGANKFQQFMKITLPSLARTAYPLLISSFAFNFNNFGSAFLITDGGPARFGSQFAGYTDILASTSYKMSTTFGRWDMAATLSVLTFLVIGTISFIQMKLSGQFEEVD